VPPRWARRLWIYQRYVHGNLIGGLVIALMVLVPVHAAAAVFLAPALVVSSGNVNPGFGVVTGLTGLILVFLVVFLVASFAGDLSGGGAQLFLSQPISRKVYAATWLLAVVATPALIYLLSVALPLLAIDPGLLHAVGFTEIGLSVVEVLEMGSLLFLAALLTRSRAAVVVLGLFVEFLLPWIMLIPFAMLAAIPGGQPPWLTQAIAVYLVLYPSKLPLFLTAPQGPPLTPAQVAGAALTLTALYWAAALAYADRRMEVR